MRIRGTKNVSDFSNVTAVARDIEKYFEHNPDAGDTVDGIADWWLAKERIDKARNHVHQALEYLVREGVLTKYSYGHREVYVTVENSQKQSQK